MLYALAVVFGLLTSRTYDALTAEAHERQTWTFAPDKEPEGFLHDTLVDLIGKLGRLEAKQKAAVKQRLDWARRISKLSLAHPNVVVEAWMDDIMITAS